MLVSIAKHCFETGYAYKMNTTTLLYFSQNKLQLHLAQNLHNTHYYTVVHIICPTRNLITGLCNHIHEL